VLLHLLDVVLGQHRRRVTHGVPPSLAAAAAGAGLAVGTEERARGIDWSVVLT
jgi:hypothetical protein